MRTHLVIIVNILLIVLLLSSCVTPQNPGSVQSTSSITSQPTAWLISTPIPEDLTHAISVRSTGTNTIEITNLSVNRSLKVFRRFTNQIEMVIELRPQETYVDNLMWDGSQYFYWGEDGWGNRTNEVEATTELAEITKQRGVFYSWSSAAKQLGKFKTYPDESITYSYLAHGVNVKVIYEPVCTKKLSDSQMEQFFLVVAGLFDKQWQLYEGFPLDEYHFVCSDDPMWEDQFGTTVGLDWLLSTPTGLHFIDKAILDGGGSDLSHWIGHAWQMGVIEYKNGGLIEGFTQYNCEVSGLPVDSVVEKIREEMIYSQDISEPIDPDGIMGPPWVYSKGAILSYKISVILQEDAGLTYQQFLKYLYDQYFLPYNGPSRTYTRAYLSTQQALQALNDFSGLDFSDLFNDDVYERSEYGREFPVEERFLPVFVSASGENLYHVKKHVHNYDELNLISPKDGMPMVYVPAGEFTMGFLSSNGNQDIKPQHSVDLDAFWIDQKEITNGMYEKCVAAGACSAPAAISTATREQYYGNGEFQKYPVVNVDWSQAKSYCEWAGKRLPSEAEWEKAARGTTWLEYGWGEDGGFSNLANINITDDTTAVGTYPDGLSPYGALDMVGNVWEWVADWYDPVYYQNSPFFNPQGPSEGEERVIRGGAFDSGLPFYIFSRDKVNPSKYYGSVGFRCAISIPFGFSSNPISRSTITPTLTSTPGPSPTPTSTYTPTRTPTITPTAKPGAIQIITKVSPIDGMSLMYVPEGEFIMGDGEYDPVAMNNNPKHLVYLDAFWIDKTEVTNDMYNKCIEAGACSPVFLTNSFITSDQYNYPVRGVSWYMARDYCAWAGRDLPTQAQWEKAARGTDGRKYPWGNQYPDETLLQWQTTVYAPVGSHPNGASPYGALDMSGNVSEWVSDWFGGPLSTEPASNPQGPETGLYKIVRGGDIEISQYEHFMVFDYQAWPKLSGYYAWGFRCALNTTAKPEAISLPPIVDSAQQSPSRVSPKDGMTMINIPAGDFWMGGDEPQQVFVEDFWIDQTEVTTSMYEKCVNDGACSPPQNTGTDLLAAFYGLEKYANHPVVNVDANQAKTYCAWAGKRLPSEAEWEKAARGTDARQYPWGNVHPTSIQWYFEAVGSDPIDVSPYGVLDMEGIVMEWTDGIYPVFYTGLANQFVYPQDVTLVRGSAWGNNLIPVYHRIGYPATYFDDSIGFRCVMDSNG